MRGPALRRLILIVPLLLLPLASSAAQRRRGLELTVATDHVWRGLTRAGATTLQPAGWVEVPLARTGIRAEAGAWLAAYTHDSQLLKPRFARWRLREANFWLQGTGTAAAGVDASAGVLHYEYLGPAARTTEVYAQLATGSGRLALGPLPLDARAAAFWDVGSAPGGYLEAEAGVGVPILPVATLLLSVEAGASVGRPATPASNPGLRRFTGGNGLTHVDASASLTPALSRACSAFLSLHRQWAIDPAARGNWWWEMGLSRVFGSPWSKP